MTASLDQRRLPRRHGCSSHQEFIAAEDGLASLAEHLFAHDRGDLP